MNFISLEFVPFVFQEIMSKAKKAKVDDEVRIFLKALSNQILLPWL